MHLLGTFRSLRSTNYRIWAAGALVSYIGTWMQRTAQDWLVLTQLTPHNAAAVGIVMSLQFGPQLLLLPWTGFAADHYDQRKLLIATQATMGVLALTLGVLTVTGIVQLWQVYVFAFLSGCASAFDAPVRQIFVAELVGEKDLSNAIALNSTSFNMARMIGPAVAGLTIASVGTGWAFLLNGSSFFAVLASLFFLRVSGQHAKVRALRTKGSLTEGLRYVWARPDLKAILLMLFLIGTFGMNFPIFISTMAVTVFHTDARGYGLLTSTLAIGTIVGALLAAGRERPQFKSLLSGAAIFGVGCTLAALAPNYGLFAVALVIIGVGAMTFQQHHQQPVATQHRARHARSGDCPARRRGLGGHAHRCAHRRLGCRPPGPALGAGGRRSGGHPRCRRGALYPQTPIGSARKAPLVIGGWGMQ